MRYQEAPYLRPGDEVGIASPSFAVNRQKVIDAVNVLEEWGLKVRLGQNVFCSEGPFAGTDAERIADIQAMIDDPSIKAIIFSRGGYGVMRIIDKLDFSAINDSPKWFVGFSDITVFHLWLSSQHHLVTIHGEMPVNYCNPDKSLLTFQSLHDALFGQWHPIEWNGRTLRAKDAEGQLVGGNLSLIYGLMGTPAEIQTDGKILFVEDVGEHYYHIDRMLTSLRLAGKLTNLEALIVGGFNKMEETTTPWGKSIEDIVSEVTSGCSYPVFFGFPAGHVADNRAFYLGRRAHIATMGFSSMLEYTDL